MLRVPKPDWFVKVRSKQDALLKAQRDQFLQAERGPFMISFDATRLHQDSTLALGCFDRDNEYLVLGMRKVEAKSGRELAAVMMAMIEEHPTLKSNVRTLITDRAPAQVLANQMVVDMINQNRAPEDHCIIVSCLMHTTLNAAFLKAVDRKFTTMGDEHVQMVSMSIQNHLALWMASHPESIPNHGADRAYHELRRKRAERFTLESAIERFESSL